MAVYMGDISAAGDVDCIRKGIRNCAKLEIEKKMKCGIKKKKKKEEEVTTEKIKEKIIKKGNRYKYLGMVIG